MNHFRLSCALLALVAGAQAQSSYYLYDKNDLKPYVSVGGDYRFAQSTSIQQSVLGARYFEGGDTVFYQGVMTTLPSKLVRPGHGALNTGSWGLFGETDVINLPGIHLEAGAYYHNWQFGAALSHSFFLTSKAPSDTMIVSYSGFAFDSAGTMPVRYKLNLFDAGFSMTDYSMVTAYRLKSSESALNLGIRTMLGLSQVDIVFPAEWLINYSEGSGSVKYYSIDNQTYSSLGWHAGLELTPSIRLGNFELVGAIGYKSTTYDRIHLTQDEKLRYLMGKDGNDLSNYYGGLRLNYVWPSFNEKKN